LDAFSRLRSLFTQTNTNGTAKGPQINIAAQIETIRSIEFSQTIPTGQRIHGFSYANLLMRLDRDVMGIYRITVNQGSEKRFSFSINCEKGDYEKLGRGLEEVIRFLDGKRSIRSLPNHELVRGYYYGA